MAHEEPSNTQETKPESFSPEEQIFREVMSAVNQTYFILREEGGDPWTIMRQRFGIDVKFELLKTGDLAG